MNEQAFDRITRNVARHSTSRRGFFGLLGAAAAGGLAVVGLGERARWDRALAAADSEEQSVMLFEKLAQIVDEHVGSCSEMRDKVRQFRDEQRDLMDQVSVEQGGWTREQRVTHADTYGDRRWAAMNKILAGTVRCKFTLPESSLGSVPAGTPEASPAAVMAGLASSRIPAGGGFDALAQATCNVSLEAFCVRPAEPNRYEWSSTAWEATATCTDPFDCTVCGHSDSECATKYPDMCVDEVGNNRCSIDYYYSADTCAYSVQAQCWHSSRNVPIPGSGFAASAKCDGGTCTVCDVSPTYCSDHFPGQCEVNECEVVVNQGQSCTTPIQVVCLDTRDSGDGVNWSSPQWELVGNCENGPGNCTVCQSDDICASRFPDNCVSGGTNYCTLTQDYTPPPPSCCSDNCPASSGDCGYNGVAAIFGDYHCAGCMLSWCGSTSSCLEHCESEGCCKQACSEAEVPPVEGGEGRTGGTPIPGTPTTAGTAPPATVALPTEPPPTVALPTEPPATPSSPVPLD